MSTNPHQDEAPQPDAHSAAQERVTSEELTQALARIDARKETDAHRASETIPLGQAIEELGLEATSAEIFAEVQAHRQRTVSSLDSRPTPATSDQPPDLEHTIASPITPPLTHCPACSRKLLTQASALCNWCGAKISDPQYQEQAALSRQNLDQQERSQVETVALEEARYGIFGRLKRRGKQNPGSRSPLG